MAKAFTPNYPYSTPIELLTPTYGYVKGVKTKTWPVNGTRLNCSFKTYGGTESNVNDLYSVIDTANIETWYNPAIKSECRIKNLLTGNVYEIIGAPENIDMRNQFIKFKVRAVQGGA